MKFESSHGDIYYEVHGQNDAMTVVFMHGMLVDHKMFLQYEVVAALEVNRRTHEQKEARSFLNALFKADP